MALGRCEIKTKFNTNTHPTHLKHTEFSMTFWHPFQVPSWKGVLAMTLTSNFREIWHNLNIKLSFEFGIPSNLKIITWGGYTTNSTEDTASIFCALLLPTCHHINESMNSRLSSCASKSDSKHSNTSPSGSKSSGTSSAFSSTSSEVGAVDTRVHSTC